MLKKGVELDYYKAKTFLGFILLDPPELNHKY